jgi:hypothetical protein
VYLAAIAFVPFPTALVGIYGSEQAVVIVLYAVTLAIASTLEVVLFWHAQQADLFRKRLDDATFRKFIAASLAPAVVFGLSIPVAILYDPGIGLLTWLLIFPAEFFIGKYLRTD